MSEARSVRVLVRPEGDYLVAQCLEHDIAAQGRTMQELVQRFTHTFLGHIALALEHGEVPLVNLPEAPRWYFQQYEDANRPEEEVEIRYSRRYPPPAGSPRPRKALLKVA